MESLVLFIFVSLSVFVFVFESYFKTLTIRKASKKSNQFYAKKLLNITDDDMTKTYKYAYDLYKLGLLSGSMGLVIKLSFIVFGGLGYLENFVKGIFFDPVIIGVIFFQILIIFYAFIDLPVEFYKQFVIENKHGFNRQSKKLFFLDFFKNLTIGFVLNGILLFGILYIMEYMGNFWWIFAWICVMGFLALNIWIYPFLLAPLFNKFKKIENKQLLSKIKEISKDIGFNIKNVFVMDASKRSGHVNAYFTGLFNNKQVVLFDTLINKLNENEIIAVLAHELGHFKLNHIKKQLFNIFLMTGVFFYALQMFISVEVFYSSFRLSDFTNYGALLIFSLWFGLILFFIKPIYNARSRKHEFEADSFAAKISDAKDLSSALLKLRKENKSLPLVHHLHSMWEHSHPPIIERLEAMGYLK